jgi:hypothetical protein
VNYGELRSTGYPSFSNTRHEVSILAALEEGETAQEAIRKLDLHARAEVQRQFGDKPVASSSDMERPYHDPETTNLSQ